MHKEIFTFSLADCRFGDDYRDDVYLKKLETIINAYIGKSKNISFFSTAIERDFIASAGLSAVSGLEGVVDAHIEVGTNPCDESGSEFSFAIRLKHGEVTFTSPWFDKDCNIAISFSDDTLVFRHLFKDGDYLQTIKF